MEKYLKELIDKKGLNEGCKECVRMIESLVHNCHNSVEADLHENHDMTFADFITDLEVIGNIYDHPELMKSENNE